MQECIQEFSNLLEMGTAAVLKLLADADVFPPTLLMSSGFRFLREFG